MIRKSHPPLRVIDEFAISTNSHHLWQGDHQGKVFVGPYVVIHADGVMQWVQEPLSSRQLQHSDGVVIHSSPVLPSP